MKQQIEIVVDTESSPVANRGAALEWRGYVGGSWTSKSFHGSASAAMAAFDNLPSHLDQELDHWRIVVHKLDNDLADATDDFGGFTSAEAEREGFAWMCEAAEGEALLSEMLADDFGGDLGDFGADV